MARLASTRGANLRFASEYSGGAISIEQFLLLARAADVETAQTITHQTILGWWDGSVKMLESDRLGLQPVSYPRPLYPISNELQESAYQFGRALARLEVIRANAVVGNLYTALLPSAHRSEQGIFYTPPVLVEHVLNRAEQAGHNWLTCKAVDPACGAGVFVLAAASRMLRNLAGSEPRILLTNVGTRLRGWDLDPMAAWITQVSAEILVLPHVVSCMMRLPRIASQRNTLAAFQDGQGQFALVMGNPAFGKIKLTPKIAGNFRRSLYGHANTYGLFTDVAVRLAQANGGIVAFVTPPSYLSGQYFTALRRMLRREAPPTSIDIVESRHGVFSGVLQEVAVSVFKREIADAGASCAIVRLRDGTIDVQQTGTLTFSERLEDPWLLPRHSHHAGLVSRLHEMPTRLSDLGYRVSTGPLVWNRHKTQLHLRPANGRVPVIWADAVTQQCKFSEDAVKLHHRCHRWYEPSRISDPSLVNKSCILVQRTTAKEQDRRLVCAVLPASFIRKHRYVAVENHLNMIVSNSTKPAIPLKALSIFLKTHVADQILRCISGSVAISATELEAMPLPSAEELLRACKSADVEAAIRRLYRIETSDAPAHSD